jgi:hypothetical protein
MGDLKEEVIAKAKGVFNQKPGESISEVKKATEDMNVVEGALHTARKLAGTDGLAEQIKGKDAALAKAGEEKDKLKEELHETQIQIIQKELGGKIDKLSESIRGGASPKSISDEIIEVKKAAESLGLGGSKVSEIKEIMGLVTSLSPQQKGLAEQVKDARDLLATLQPEGKREALVEGVPASVAIQLKEMDTNLKITLEKMADERIERENRFKLTLMEFQEDRDLRRQEVDGKLALERERNQILANAIEIGGRAAGKAFAETKLGAGAPSQEGISQQGQDITPRAFDLNANEGEAGQFSCPVCEKRGTPHQVGIGPKTAKATCVGCGSQFNITRVPVAAQATASDEPKPPGEE